MATRWTDQMHACFLDRMEASFVEGMLMGGAGWRLPPVGSRHPDRLPSPSPSSSEVVSAPPQPHLNDTAVSSRDRSRREVTAARTRRERRRDAEQHRTSRRYKTRKISSCQRYNGLVGVDQAVPILEGQSLVAAAMEELTEGEMSSSSLSFEAELNNKRERTRTSN